MLLARVCRAACRAPRASCESLHRPRALASGVRTLFWHAASCTAAATAASSSSSQASLPSSLPPQPLFAAPAASCSSLDAVAAMRYLSPAEAAAVDEELMKQPGFSIDQLMELAGLSCAAAVADAFPAPAKTVLVAVGPGNNGGDGLVCARHLFQFGYKVTVAYPKRNGKPLFVNLVQQVTDVGIDVVDAVPPDAADAYDVVIDAVFGFSFKRPLRAPFPDVLVALARVPRAKLLAIDVPSGWDVAAGAPAEPPIVRPGVLVSLTWPKQGVAAFDGRHYLGGRFVPPGIAAEYGIDTGGYKGAEQIRLLSAGGGGEGAGADAPVVVVWITAPVGEADKLIEAIISAKLAACVNKIDGVCSTYMWKGAVETDTEALLMAKTTAARLPELTAFVQDKHSYDVPETIAATIVGGNAAYLKWVASSVL